MNERPLKTEQVSIRLSEELRKNINEEAALQKRKPANLMTIILEEYFENKERIKKIETKRQ